VVKLMPGIVLFVGILLTGAQGAANVGKISAEGVAIRIDDLTIDMLEFEAIFRSAVRQKYYHGRVPPEELKLFRQQVAQDIVTQVIVHQEARQKGLPPDRETIAREIEEYDKRYADSPDWQAQRERVMPQLALRLERQNLLQKMEAQIKSLPQPGADRVLAFYRNNPDKFTEPERVWGSVLLLSVAPSAGEQAWLENETLALQLKFRIENGEDFATLAKQYSAHPSALNGGDLGYLHEGVLEQRVQQQVDALEIGEISESIRVLEGIVLFRLNGIQAQQLKPFEDVQRRAAGLLYREMQDHAWENYVRDLKASADIFVNKNLYVQSIHE